MTLSDLGYTERLAAIVATMNPGDFSPGRIAAEYRERYTLLAESGEYEAEITGTMRFTARGREDFPAVGDWVLASLYEGGLAIIHAIVPRTTLVARRASGEAGELQVIAGNIDCALLVQAADRDFNPNRLERYLTLCNDSGIVSIIVMTKIDLISEIDIDTIKSTLHTRFPNIDSIFISNATGQGIGELKARLEPGRSYCLLGSSGAGKSSLLNTLAGTQAMATGAVSEANGKGRHVTSHRELFMLEGGAILIDNPGLREVGMAESGEGLDRTFEEITRLAASCRYQDCSHLHEAGCAVLEAVRTGELEESVYQNYVKLKKEIGYFEASRAELRRKDKDFGHMMKTYHRDARLKKF